MGRDDQELSDPASRLGRDRVRPQDDHEVPPAARHPEPVEGGARGVVGGVEPPSASPTPPAAHRTHARGPPSGGALRPPALAGGFQFALSPNAREPSFRLNSASTA